MNKISGMGCAIGSTAAFFSAFIDSPFAASYMALALFRYASKNAASKTDGAGSFRQAFVNELGARNEKTELESFEEFTEELKYEYD